MNLFKFAKLYDRNGDLTKRWFVGYKFLNPETKKFQLFQIYLSSKLLDKYSRITKSKEIIENINSKLLQGFNPFINENTAYITVIEAVNKVINSKATYTRKRTISTYKSFVNTFFNWLNQIKLSKLKIEYFNYQYAINFSDYLKIEKKVTNRTHNNYIDGLTTIFNELVEREYLLKNPFKKIRSLPEEKRNIFAYNEIELKTLST